MSKTPVEVLQAYRRDQILAAAREVITERGYDRSSVDQIAKRAGLSRSTVYEYFASKAEILRGCLANRRELLAQELARRVDREVGLEPQLAAFFEVCLSRVDENRAFFARAEAIRLQAGQRMGLGDVSQSVTPKITLLAAPRHGGTIAARYFMPWSCHPSMAVTGAQCIAACAITPGTVADGLVDSVARGPSPVNIGIEHATGTFDVLVDFRRDGDAVAIRSAGVVRTARLLARGEVLIPATIWTR